MISLAIDTLSNRMEEIDGSVRLASQPGHGTTLRFTADLPFHPPATVPEGVRSRWR